MCDSVYGAIEQINVGLSIILCCYTGVVAIRSMRQRACLLKLLLWSFVTKSTPLHHPGTACSLLRETAYLAFANATSSRTRLSNTSQKSTCVLAEFCFYLHGDPHWHHLLGVGELPAQKTPTQCQLCDEQYCTMIFEIVKIVSREEFSVHL